MYTDSEVCPTTGSCWGAMSVNFVEQINNIEKIENTNNLGK